MTFVAALGLWQETSYYLDGKQESLLATAEAFAAASADAVALKDESAAYRAIRGIAAVPEIQFASLTDTLGRPFANIGSGVRLQGDLDISDRDGGASPLALLITRTVSVSVAVRREGLSVGHLVLVSDVSALWGRLAKLLVIDGLGAAGALAIGLGISLKLQRSITRPLMTLAKAMSAIQTSHDYRTTVVVASDDEIGTLASSFNAMLGEVQERDQRLIAHRDRLEQDVADRTHDLKLAKDEAEHANAAKSSFLATMSHEIRTPMNGMMVMAELLAASDLPERQRRYADVIARSGQSLLAIINDILDLSKIEAGKLTLEAIEFSPITIIDTVVTLFAERANSKALDLAAFVAPDVPAAMVGDPVRLTQVLSNLVNNALKFTEEGHVLVAAAWGQGQFRLSVSDTGIGIPAEKIASIFDAFSQADQSTTRRFGGTGLGLSISRRIVDAMGGIVELRSKEGQGSTFTVSLPWSVGAVQSLSENPQPHPVALRLRGTATAEAAQRSLVAAGFSCAEGVSTDPHDLVIDAADLLREGRPLAAARVVGVAAIDDPSGAEVVRRGLADSVIRRPIVQEEWREVLGCLKTGASFASALTAREPSGRADLDSFAGLHVLVADDNAVNREVACEALARLGVSAEAVESGRAALEAIGSRDFDLVLMDGSMPDMDGYEATRIIRETESGTSRRLPVIALTAHVVGKSADLWRQAGMDDVLHKPFTVAKLVDVLRRNLTSDRLAALPRSGLGEAASAAPPVRVNEETALLDLDTIAGIHEMAGPGAGDAFWKRILAHFAEGGPPCFLALREATARREASAVASAAHKLKSMSLNIGGIRLAKMLAAIEEMALEHGVIPTSGCIESAELCFAETNAALQDRVTPSQAEALAA